MVDRNIFREVYRRANIKQLYLIDSKSSGKLLYSLSQKYKFNKELDILLCRTVSEIVLGFYKIEDTVPLLQQELGIDPKTAALLGAEVLEFLAPLNDPNWQPPVEEDEGEESTEAATSPVAVPARAINISSVPSNGAPTPTEDTSVAPPVVQTIPTIAPVATPTPAYAEPHEPAYQPSPAVPEPTYQSSQNDLRPATRPLGEVPTYVPPVAPVVPPTPPAADRPRWSTDV